MDGQGVCPGEEISEDIRRDTRHTQHWSWDRVFGSATLSPVKNPTDTRTQTHSEIHPAESSQLPFLGGAKVHLHSDGLLSVPRFPFGKDPGSPGSQELEGKATLTWLPRRSLFFFSLPSSVFLLPPTHFLLLSSLIFSPLPSPPPSLSPGILAQPLGVSQCHLSHQR